MAYQTLYRKYRPQKFEFVYGQDSIIKTLKFSIKKEQINHAYLFTGPRGTGKTSCAKLFAKSINCLNNIEGDACNKCENCKAFNENSNPDIIEIDAASNNGVDEIREIKNKVNLVPSMSKYKVYIIDEVHMLSIGAFNALLKTLEEPPEYVIFILATTEPQKLPNTVISRCQRYDFKSINVSEMKKCLLNISDKENIDITDSALIEISNISKGGMRDAIGLLEQAWICTDGKINEKDIELLSGNISDDEMYDFFETLLKNDYVEIIKKIVNYEAQGKDFLVITQKILNFSHKGLIYKKIKNTNYIIDDEKLLFDKCSDTKFYFIIDAFNQIIYELKKNYQKQLTFEINIIQLIDKLSENKFNVSRETLNIETKKEDGNVSRETYKQTQNEKNELVKYIEELKKVRINNILKGSTKSELEFIIKKWKNITELLLDEEFKKVSNIMIEGNPVAASVKGIIITFPVESLLNKMEKKYDLGKKIIKKIYDREYKIVCITEKHWKEIRPEFVIKAKNNQLEIKDEQYLLSKINKIINENSVSEFNDLIEMEEK